MRMLECVVIVIVIIFIIASIAVAATAVWGTVDGDGGNGGDSANEFHTEQKKKCFLYLLHAFTYQFKSVRFIYYINRSTYK